MTTERDVVAEIPSIVSWIQSRVLGAGSEGCVVGLSGGIDSSVVGALCQRAFPDATLGLIMPCSESDDDFTERAMELARVLGIATLVHPIGEAHMDLAGGLGPGVAPDSSAERRTVALGNLRSRLRMCLLYLYANLRSALVVGTGNRDEDHGVGYFTKYGDGGVDISPLADFHKSEVYGLGRALGVPERILAAAPSAGLWEGQADEGELGMTYDEVRHASAVLDGMAPELAAPEKLTPRQIEVVAKVSLLRRRNRHKLEPPPVYRRRS